MPAANKIGRRFVFLASTIITAASSIWAGAFHGTLQWMLNNAMNGVGTAAYQAIIQLAVSVFRHFRRYCFKYKSALMLVIFGRFSIHSLSMSEVDRSLSTSLGSNLDPCKIVPTH